MVCDPAKGATAMPEQGAERPGRDWLAMSDPREFDTSVKETQGALFPSRRALETCRCSATCSARISK